MIAWLLFVLIFLGLGLGVVFAAFTGGSRRRGRQTVPSRGSRRAMGLVAGLVIIAIGILVPALVLAANGSDEKAPGGVQLSSSDTKGREIFAKNCSTCHTLRAANAVGRVGPNLDDLRPPKALVLNAIAEGRARGQGQMPAGLIDGQDAQDVAGFVAKVAGR
jgi:mono/diheme cytochrome c family protein